MSDESNRKNNLSALSNDEIDNILMMEIQGQWQKVARIIAKIMDVYNPHDEEKLLSRIKALVGAGKIESAGDIERPRFSEVRLFVDGQFGRGIAAYSRKDFITAMMIFEPLGNGGEGGASWRMGEMYAKGLGVEKNVELAEQWYRKAVAQGFLPAQKSLESLKGSGNSGGVKPNPDPPAKK